MYKNPLDYKLINNNMMDVDVAKDLYKSAIEKKAKYDNNKLQIQDS